MSRHLARLSAALLPRPRPRLAAPASAHVTVSSPDATAGGFGKVVFRVPTESETASTTKLGVTLPEDTPFAFVSAQPKPGWKVDIKKAKLGQTDHLSRDDADQGRQHRHVDEPRRHRSGRVRRVRTLGRPVPGGPHHVVLRRADLRRRRGRAVGRTHEEGRRGAGTSGPGARAGRRQTTRRPSPRRRTTAWPAPSRGRHSPLPSWPCFWRCVRIDDVPKFVFTLWRS